MLRSCAPKAVTASSAKAQASVSVPKSAFAAEPNPWQPLANAQLGVFFGHHLNPESAAFTTAEVVKVSGGIDHSALTDAVSAAYAQFPQLRATFRLSPDGPQQRFAAPGPVALPLLECATELAAEAAITELMARPLDIYSGEVTRTLLLRLPEQDWWVHAAHHLVMDGYGAHQFIARVRELLDDPASAKSVACLDELPDFEAPEALDFWRERISDYQGRASLPAISAEPSVRAIREQLLMPRALQDLLRSRAQELKTTWGELFTAITGSYLARMLQAPSIRCGLPLMNRSLPGVGALPQSATVCTAVNVLPVTIPATGSIVDAVAELRHEQAEIRKHPFTRQETLARQLTPDTDLFGAQINLIPFERALLFAGHSASITNLSAGPVYDLTITLRGMISRANSRDKELSLELDANPALYSAEQLRWHLDRLLAWAKTVCLAPDDAPLASLPLLSDRERREVSEVFNDTAQSYDFKSPATRFRAQASRTPDAIALDDGVRQLSYAELAHAAESMAAELADLGVRSGSVVGVRLERSIRLFVSVCALALLEATYLPLDPDLPAERVSAMVSDAGAVAIIDAQSIARTELLITPSTLAGLDQIAYVLFTSGSTGTPKGVAVSQLALDNRLRWMQAELPIGVGDVVLHKTPISFDVSVWELFWPLQEGATVRIAPPGAHRDPRELAPLLDSVAVVHFVPSMLAALLADRAAVEVLQNARAAGRGVACVVTSGEALTPALVARCVEALGTAPVNLYGPTEAAIDVTIWRSSAGEAEVPIGVPVPNTQCFVLDEAGDLVPIGVPGELWLGGVQLAAGYVSRPDLTAERFVETRFGRLYRTGDLAAWRCDGALRYLGRNDFQVKLRGQRVELGEIDSLVAAQTGVSQSVVVLCDDQLLCAVVGTADFDDLRSACERKLPASWVPSLWFRMPRLPISGSGKTDRGAVIEAFRAQRSSVDLPLDRGSVAEEQVAAVFAEVCGFTPFPIAGDFFAHGGDSLRALRLLNVLEDRFETRVDLATLFANPSPRALLKALPDLLAKEQSRLSAHQASSRCDV